MINLIKLKQNYFTEIDNKSKYLAKRLSASKKISKQILEFIIELYDSENESNNNFNKDNYKSSGHQPITSDFEFFISRILYYYSKINKLNWEISLRCSQQDKNTKKQVQPDILIRRKNKIIAILEIKVKAGYMQCVFSKIREKKDIEKGYNTKEIIDKTKSQLKKYSKLESCGKKKIFVLLPTFALVSRKNNAETADNFRSQFAKNTRLNKDNLIILSKNKDLDLSKSNGNLDATGEFERFIKNISARN